MRFADERPRRSACSERAIPHAQPVPDEIKPAKPSWLQGRIFGAPVVTKKQKTIAMAIAVVADLLQVAVFPVFVEGAASPFADALDLAVAIALVATLGASGRLLAALALELTPFAALFPTWTAVVASISTEPDVIQTTGESVTSTPTPGKLPSDQG